MTKTRVALLENGVRGLGVSLQQVLFRLVALLIIAAVHGYTLALTADRLGDPGPRYDGRRSLNPFVHLDTVGALCLVVFGFGWIKPVALEARLLRFGRFGPVLVALAGLSAVVALAGVAELLRRPLIGSVSGNLPLYGVVLLEAISTLSLAFVLLNIIPLMPLTGVCFLTVLAPTLEPVMLRYRTAFTVVVAAIVASGLADRVFLPVYRPVARFLLGA